MNSSCVGQASSIVVSAAQSHHHHHNQQQQQLFTSAAAGITHHHPQHYHQQPRSHHHSLHHHHQSADLHLQPSSQNLIHKQIRPHATNSLQLGSRHSHTTATSPFSNQLRRYLSPNGSTTQRQQLVEVIANTSDCKLAECSGHSVGLTLDQNRSPLFELRQQQEEENQLMQLDIDEVVQQQTQQQPISPVRLVQMDATTNTYQQQQDLTNSRPCTVADYAPASSSGGINIISNNNNNMHPQIQAPPVGCAPQQQQPLFAGRARVNSVSSPMTISSGFQQQPARQRSPFAIARSTSFSASTRRPVSRELLAFGQQQQIVASDCANTNMQLMHNHQLTTSQLQFYRQTSSPGSSINSASPIAGSVTPLQQPLIGAQKSGYASSGHSSSPSCGPQMGYSGAGHQSSMSPSDALNLGINLEQYISKRNERERSRVRNVNDAFDNLKNSLPLDIERLTKRMSKVEILRTAIGYIRNLEDVLGYKQQQQPQAYHQYNHQHHLQHQTQQLDQQLEHQHQQQQNYQPQRT